MQRSCLSRTAGACSRRRRPPACSRRSSATSRSRSRRPTTRRWCASSCKAATTARTRWSASTPRATTTTPRSAPRVRHQHSAGAAAADPACAGGPPFGFHPACAPLQALFDRKKLAVVANVGMLAQPSTRVGTRDGRRAASREPVLALRSGARVQTGGPHGRRAPRLGRPHRGPAGRLESRARSFPPVISVSGLRIFVNGARPCR